MSLSFLFPGAFLAIPAGVFLLYKIFRRGGDNEPLRAGTTFLLRHLASPINVRRRFFPPLRFWLLLSALLFLALGSAQFIGQQKALKVAVIIDNSFQSSAITSTGKTLLERAQEHALESISRLTAPALFEIATTGGSGASSPALNVAKDASSIISVIEPQYISESIQNSVSRILAHDRFDELWIFSAQKVQFAEDETFLRRHYIPTLDSEEQPPRNVAISSISILPDKSNGRQNISVSINQFGEQNVGVSVELSAADPTQAPLSWRTIDSKELSLAPNSSQRAEFDLAEVGQQIFRAKISAKREFNALSGDDSAWISQSADRPRVTVISDLNSYELGLENIGGTEFNYLSSAEYKEQAQSLKNAPVIFHHHSIDKLPSTNALWIAPEPSPESLCTISEPTGTAEITRWDNKNPLTRYIEFSLLNLPSATKLKCQEWFESLLNSTEGDLWLAGQHNGYRYSVIGFELLPFEKNARASSIIFLNLLSWLSEGVSSSGFKTVGDFASNGVSLEYLDENSPALSIAADTGIGRARFNRPGLVKLKPNSRPPYFTGVNFFSPSQSNLRSAYPVTVSTLSQVEKQVATTVLPPWWALGALLFLILDMVWQLRTRKKGRA